MRFDFSSSWGDPKGPKGEEAVTYYNALVLHKSYKQCLEALSRS